MPNKKLIVAKTVNGKEFMWSFRSAYLCNAKTAKTVADILTKTKYDINDGEHWHVYEMQYGDDEKIMQEIRIAKNGDIRTKLR